ncbi:50S ribosomal protein L11 [Candidatus Zinderia endosymbiont of Aphrophora alni]|uniref:50S ribosomal protein L11 n=1 Tax=Candidatus Zinderia endosymbiont of Aphrophora alni TaxID=3077951 RepID=UPI0030D00595
MKKIIGFIKLQILAGKATPAPPIGPALGQRGLNIMEFCKNFNNQTKNLESDLPIPVVITVFFDKSFDFILKTPPTSVLIKKILGIDKGSSKPNLNKVGTISMKQIEEIALKKRKNLTSNNLSGAIRTIIGSAISMGVLVKN